MRAFKVVSKKKQEELVELFPVLDSVEDESLESWESMAVSVFDHWLNRDDAIRFFEQRTQSEQASIDAAWAKFNHLIATELRPYMVKYRSVGKVWFKQPRSAELLANRLRITNKQPFVTLAFPEQKAVYIQGYDDTHLLYFECQEKIQPFLKIVEKAGLYELPRI